MRDYQQRMVEEHGELLGRIVQLEAFRGLETQVERDRMSLQLIFMRGYAAALAQRIEAFDDETG